MIKKTMKEKFENETFDKNKKNQIKHLKKKIKEISMKIIEKNRKEFKEILTNALDDQY